MISQNEADLSRDEDLTFAVMNLISLEEHLAFTAVKTQNFSYLHMLQDVRTVRKEAMQQLVKNPKGETWCASKHTLAASMRFLETAVKEQQAGRKKEAEEWMNRSFELFALFFALNGDIIANTEDSSAHESTPKKSWTKIVDAVKKMVDCCKE